MVFPPMTFEVYYNRHMTTKSTQIATTTNVIPKALGDISLCALQEAPISTTCCTSGIAQPSEVSIILEFVARPQEVAC